MCIATFLYIARQSKSTIIIQFAESGQNIYFTLINLLEGSVGLEENPTMRPALGKGTCTTWAKNSKMSYCESMQYDDATPHSSRFYKRKCRGQCMYAMHLKLACYIAGKVVPFPRAGHGNKTSLSTFTWINWFYMPTMAIILCLYTMGACPICQRWMLVLLCLQWMLVLYAYNIDIAGEIRLIKAN